MHVNHAFSSLGNVQTIAPFLIAQNPGITIHAIESGRVPPGVGLMFDVNEALFNEAWNELSNRLNIDASFGGDALETVVNQAKFVFPLVLGAPQEIVDFLFY